MSDEIQTLLHNINHFCGKHNLQPTTFGRLAMNDGKFVARLTKNGKCLTTTVEKVKSFMDTYVAPQKVRDTS